MAIAMPPASSFFPLSLYAKHVHVGQWVSTIPPALWGTTTPTHACFGQKVPLRTASFPSFFPTQLRFVAVHWTVGFPRLQGTDGCLVSESRTNSLPRLSLSCLTSPHLLLRSDHHSTLMEEEQKEAERNERGSERDKAMMLREAG